MSPQTSPEIRGNLPAALDWHSRISPIKPTKTASNRR